MPLQYQIHAVDTIKSTNTSLKALAKDGAAEGYVLIASAQTNGRGRLNRVFFSPKGSGLYLSILLRPACSLPPYALTCMAAVALTDTIEDFKVPCKIKWVNDIYIQNKKAAGILVESAMDQDGSFQYAVVGIGVNLFPPKDGFPRMIADTATAVFDSPPNEERKKQFLKRLLQRFKTYYDQLPAISFYDAYCTRQIGIGNRVMVTLPDGIQSGTSKGIDASFRLLVQCDDGTELALDRGDVVIQ
jgi:BirA family biotin operon repressor/biotin-[acetyl-CoA-carboxylase] ligase